MTQPTEWKGDERRSNPSWEHEIARLDSGHAKIIERLDRQDEQTAENTIILREVRTILLLGRAGWTFARWLGATAVAAWGVYAAWRGIK